MRRILATALVVATAPAFAEAPVAEFTEEELAVADFWQNMGPTLREEGLEAYAVRYHEDFLHWNIGRGGRVSDKSSAISAWTNFHEAGHRITCTHVEPVTINLDGDRASARLVYEQTNTYADGRVATHVYHMSAEFVRYVDAWQVLQTNMIDVTPLDDGKGDARLLSSYEFHCPGV